MAKTLDKAHDMQNKGAIHPPADTDMLGRIRWPMLNDSFISIPDNN